MANIASLSVRIGADISAFQKNVAKMEQKLKGLSKKFKQAGKALTIGVTAPLVAMGTASVIAFDKQAKAEGVLRAALIANGRQVNSLFEDYTKFASELQKVSTVGDETTIKMLQVAESMGLTGDQAKRSVKNALALAKSMGMNEQSAIRYTAALEQGDATMLTRYLPTLREFDDQAERAAKAQELLGKMFGSVTAEAEAGLGPLKQLWNSFGDLLEMFGAIIMEGLKPLINYGNELVAKLQELSPATKKIIVVVAGLAAAVGPLLLVLGGIVSVLPVIAAGFTLLSGPIGLIVAGIAVLTYGVIAYLDEAERMKSAQDKVNDTMQKATKSTYKEVAAIDTLLKTAKDESKSKEKRLAAIKKLQTKYPSYLGNLRLENINTQETTNAVLKLKDAILKRAMARAAEARLQEIAERKLQQENETVEDQIPLWEKLAGKAFSALTGMDYGFAAGISGTVKLNTETKKLNEEEAKLLEILESIGDAGADLEIVQPTGGGGKGIEDMGDAAKEVKTPMQDLLDVFFELDNAAKILGTSTFDLLQQKQEALQQAMTALANTGQEDSEEFKNMANALALVTGEMELLSAATDEQQEAEEARVAAAEERKERIMAVSTEIGSGMQRIGESMLSSMNLASTGIEGFAQKMIQTGLQLLNMLIQNAIKTIALKQAESVATAIGGAVQSGAATGPAAIFTTPAFIATAIGGVMAAFAAIPSFAKGGFAVGPQLAMVGDNPGRKEAIIPSEMFDKMGGGSVNITGELRARGTDLVLVIDKTNREFSRVGS